MGTTLQPIKELTEQEQVVYFYARGRRMSLADISKGLFRTRFVPPTPSTYNSVGWPTAVRSKLYTVMAEITIDGVSAEGVIFAAPSFCDPALLERPMLQNALDAADIPYISFKYAENSGQMQPIREQAGTFADSIKLWGET